MGYTHYFPGLTASPEDLDDARKIIDASPVTICGPKGQGLPILNDAGGIRLNGFEAAGEAHQTFRLQGTIEPPYPDMWSFSTTANKQTLRRRRDGHPDLRRSAIRGAVEERRALGHLDCRR